MSEATDYQRGWRDALGHVAYRLGLMAGDSMGSQNEHSMATITAVMDIVLAVSDEGAQDVTS